MFRKKPAHPQRQFYYLPQPDITPYELACIAPLLSSRQFEPHEWEHLVSQMPAGCARHFTYDPPEPTGELRWRVK